MKEKRLYIKYRLSGNVYEDDLYQNEHYTIEEEVSEYGIKTVIIPKEKIELIAFSLKYKRKCVAEERFSPTVTSHGRLLRNIPPTTRRKGFPHL